MRNVLPKKLILLAQKLPTPLYVVGGSVRDFLANLTPKNKKLDLDICAPLSANDFAQTAEDNGFCVQAIYRATGTVKLKDTDGYDYEFSSFRTDKYVRGVHTPVEITFTTDISLDARRRDFTVNAVYYDIKNDTFVDPLNGISAIHEKRLTTVAPASKVFGEDGLRLMRLARQAGQLGFTPDKDCLLGATQNSSLIKDITPERVFAELSAILVADEKYGVKDGHFSALKILDITRVLDYILPELTLGRDMKQRADFHDHDVLEHSLRSARYAPAPLRLPALLHDVGKPFCELRDHTSFAHPQEGARIAGEILTRLKSPKKLNALTQELVSLHMYDLDCMAGENKLRRFFALHYPLLNDLMTIKQADFSACKDNLSTAPTVKKWQALLTKMQLEHAPLSLRALDISGKDLLTLGAPPTMISTLLNQLLLHAVCNPKDNKKERLLKLALGYLKNL